MRTLVVLWDPENPLTPVAPVVEALATFPGVEVKSITFEQVSHQTMPNRMFALSRHLTEGPPDGLLWVEGGPLPSDLDRLQCTKACWLLNTHLEPTLLNDVGPSFDRVFSALLRDTADEKVRWLPLTSNAGDPTKAPEGVSIVTDDPVPPDHVQAELSLQAMAEKFGSSSVPVVVCLGNGGQVHPMLFECLRSGAAVVTDSNSDLRGIACAGEHLDTYPSREQLPLVIEKLLADEKRVAYFADRGRAIVEHLHRPQLRAAQILEGLWPNYRILSAPRGTPRISVLVTCYRYLRRLRVCLESLRRQRLPEGALEIVVADPASPDGLAGYLEQFAAESPGLRLVHLPMDPVYRRNRGVAINRAFDASSGTVVIGIDGDLVFPPDLLEYLERRVLEEPNRVFGIRRIFVPRQETEGILQGSIDPFSDFERLSLSEGDGEENSYVGVLGYCQAVHREAFAKARYPEEFDMINQSDIVFVERLAKQSGVVPCFLEERTALHLWHPRNWSGTAEFL